MKHRGLAQIPLMIGLLLMAVALPVATKLVQDNQDNRNKAMEVEDCVRDTDCGSGYRCKSGMCVKNAPTLVPTSGYCNVALIDTSDCGGGDCDNDEVEQTWRTANCGTNKVCVAKDSCKTSVCSNGQYKCVGTKSVACLNGQFNGATQECGTLGCNASTNKCNVAPTATAVPTSPSVYGKQGDLCTSTVTSGMRLPNCSTYCLNGKFYYVLAEGTYRCGVSPTSVPPTAAPTSTSCGAAGEVCIRYKESIQFPGLKVCTEWCCSKKEKYDYVQGRPECDSVQPTVSTCRNYNETCIADSNCCTGYKCRQPDPYTQEWKCLPPASPTPTKAPTKVPTTTCRTINETCLTDSNCCASYKCRQPDPYTQEWKCLPPASPTPTLRPKPCCCNSGDFGNNCFWSDKNGECHTTQSVDVWLGFYSNPTSDLSRCSGKNPNPTAVPTTIGCANEGQSCTTRSCCTGKGLECTEDGGLSYPVCVKSVSIPTAKPTTKPTVKPTVKPTSIPCASTGQACSTRSCCTTADVCTDEGLSYPKCVPRNQIPTYIPVPTIKCAKSGSSCTTMPCCEAYLDVCTDEGLSYPKCVPRNQIPTYIPVPTMLPCAKIGESCSSTLGCCGMSDKCTNGKCVATAGPSVPPTGGVKPTSGTVPTNPPSECGGKTPPDQCPMSGNPNQLGVNAQCITLNGEKVWDWDLKNCDQKGRTSACGIKNYCCPSAGGNWTTDMTQCPVTCTQCAGKPEAKGKGDADCSGVTDINDASIWRSEFTSGQLGTEVSSTWRADFDCDGKVTLNDISIWRENFIKGLTN